MDSFAKAIAAMNDLEGEGVVTKYAIGGAMATIFWAEPTPTFDLDVFVLLDQSGPLVSLEPIYSWSRRRGYREEKEHIVIDGVPVQIIPAHNALAAEAVASAAAREYGGVPVRVMRPEYLIAMALEPSARTRKRMERVAALLDEGIVHRDLLDDLLRRYELQLPQP